MNLNKIKAGFLASTIAAGSAVSAFAAEATRLEEAITGGKASVNFRLRAEFVDEDSRSATAVTERLSLGYGTKSYNGFKAFVEATDIRALVDDYNAAGLNGKGTKSVVADPEDTEINRASITYSNDTITAKVGRQRIILDDARFIGNVGWRQNEQTYDAIYFTGTPVENLSLNLGYIHDVNRIFGPDAGRDFDSESFIINAKYKASDSVNITGFAYILDFDNSPANSTDTFGFRIDGGIPFAEDYKIGYELSYAYQTDGGSSTLNYDADYYHAKASISRKGYGLGIGYEVLGSDSGTVGFKTPLATGHKFNGWADKFLATPAAGLEDLYFYGMAKLPAGISTKVFYHIFDAEEGGGEYGSELDIVASKKVNKNLSFTAKFADFYDDSSTNMGDITKFTIQTDYKF